MTFPCTDTTTVRCLLECAYAAMSAAGDSGGESMIHLLSDVTLEDCVKAEPGTVIPL